MDRAEGKPRVFLSHCSKDKRFVWGLASTLTSFGYEVWYDDWEIAVGDSIVDKVFDGLAKSDTLVIVLSTSSVASRWVREELNTSVMRRLTEGDIRILPVLIEDCDLPEPLRQVSYADFRDGEKHGLGRLLDSLTPGHLVWQSLSHLHDHFCRLCDDLLMSDMKADVRELVSNLHSVIDTGLGLRVELEYRSARQKLRDTDFFQKIDLLVDRGIEIKSDAWSSFVALRAGMAHDSPWLHNSLDHFSRLFARGQETFLDDTYNPIDGTQERRTINVREHFSERLEELKTIMARICLQQQDTKATHNKALDDDA